ncbi:SigE family RNA polymerase sigma factor [Micromonospora krabiensis]|uniref:RNA polymerase sigma-70 factor, sigma-E family n=1 Tax=Micromonospora krabiensis TaxID=307121 RepID=A0A1C3N6L6_9ACTN|nr:SigE family RNA polymerase sigma factor [Micromonospora krabiensis]SBV28227.1 RNA polymerase sigma-70 factor, sigma-E family [Micromonospora krabiensis]
MTTTGGRRAEADAEYTDYVRSRMVRWRRTAYLMTGDWDRGDDILQRVLTELYRNWARARRADNLDALVRTMLLRRLLDERRLRWTRVALGAALPERHTDPVDPTDRITLVGVLRQVPPRQRAVLVLRYFQDLSVEETAHALGCSPGTVKSQAAKGLSTLRALLAPTPTAR